MPLKEQDPELRKQYFREWASVKRDKNRVEVRKYKVEKGCADCGYNAHHAGLQFDHVADDKLYNVGTLMSTTKLLWEEIAKCEVVCGTCHAIRTYDRLAAQGKTVE